jgi:hypothetical protein
VFCERDPKVPSRLLCQVCISGYYFRSQYVYWGCQVRVCILRLGSDPNMHIGIRVCVLEPGSPNTHIRMRVGILGHFAYWYRHIWFLCYVSVVTSNACIDCWCCLCLTRASCRARLMRLMRHRSSRLCQF